jgi:acyl-CoA thioesterase
MKNIKEFFKKRDQFAKYVGLELLEAAEGRAKVRLKIQQHHLNGVNIVHGGAIFSLADFAFAVASNSHGTLALGINANISYVKASSGGVLTADAVEVAINSKLATYQINITNEKGDLIAVFQGTVYRKRNLLNEEE